MGYNYGIVEKKNFLSANVNVIYYDEGIISNFETHLNFLSIKKIVKGALFGIGDSELLRKVIELIKNSNSPPFILITSGSSAVKIVPELHKEQFIYDILIFCYNLRKYIYLKENYPKIKLIENLNFENILKFLKSKNYTLAQNKKGASYLKNDPLITFSEYEDYYYQYHHVIAKQYNNNRLQLSDDDKNNFLYYINKRKEQAKSILKDLKNDNNFAINIIKDYTMESPICYILNKSLRKLEPKTYYYIKNYACSTLYSLYYYYNQNKSQGKIEKTLYRALSMKLADILLYKVCEGEVICYPGFTSTCISEITPDKFKTTDEQKKEKNNNTKGKSILDYLSFLLIKKEYEDLRLPSPLGRDIAYEHNNEVEDIVDCVDMIIENNNENAEYPSAINISNISDKKLEEERLFPAFSFFKIKKVNILSGRKNEPHQIFLEVINKKYNLEERIYKGERVYLDSKTNLLMTRKIIND